MTANNDFSSHKVGLNNCSIWYLWRIIHLIHIFFLLISYMVSDFNCYLIFWYLNLIYSSHLFFFLWGNGLGIWIWRCSIALRISANWVIMWPKPSPFHAQAWPNHWNLGLDRTQTRNDGLLKYKCYATPYLLITFMFYKNNSF